MVKNRSVRVWWFVILTLAAVLPRLPLVQAGFAIEDSMYVQLASESDGLVSGVLDPWPIGYYRPLVSQYFEICQRVFGEWAPGYHLASIALHVVIVWLVFLLCSRLAGFEWPALYGALAFAMLPILNEAIAWTASIGDLLATGFVISAVLLALAAAEARAAVGRWLWLASLVAVVLGCGAKETSVVAGLLVPVAVWIFGRKRPGWGWIAAYPALILVYMGWYATRMPGIGAVENLVGSPWRCLTTTTQNLVMTLVPIGRNEVGDWLWTAHGVSRFLVLACVASLGVWIWLALRRRDRVLVFGWLWAVAAFIPVCRSTGADRYAYLPAVGLALVAVAVCRRFPDRRATAFALVVLTIFALGSALSAYQWTQRVGRYAAPAQNRSSIAAQWKPAPKAVSSTKSPALTRPC